ncbi:aminotransferase-like domain-containing protein [Agrococcus baldri]|uniref:GntR family transcriptional regulator n=1 Tax=Agrococcus baldri TaxID=153730 RepID=A0AA87RAQ1_9MICO|nr:PLP-dependent aminotransferase family protein [Agrococcus baldri]GEK79580.1 GntR family transcriptional regulator [Agrococcus baldri]
MTHPFLTERSRGFLPSPVRDVWEASMQPGMISLAGGNPDLSLGDLDWVAEHAARLVREQGPTVLQYGSGTGTTALREAIVRLMAAEDVAADPAAIQVTAGSQLALDLVTKVLCEQGDTVLVEDPTYVGALGTFGGAGLRVEHVAMDAEGLVPAALEERIRHLVAEGRRPRMLYTIPNFQNPSGATLSERRRPQIVELCRAAGIPIVEDNPYGMLTTTPHAHVALHELDPEHVIYLGTFSKVLSPGLRVGWAAAPGWLRRPLQLAAEATVICASPLAQELAAHFVLERPFEAEIARAAAVYAERAEAMRAALAPVLPAGATLSRPQGGFFSWLALPEGWSADALLDAAIDERVVFVPGAAFRAPGEGGGELRLAYSFESPERLAEGARRLGRALARVSAARPA